MSLGCVRNSNREKQEPIPLSGHMYNLDPNQIGGQFYSFWLGLSLENMRSWGVIPKQTFKTGFRMDWKHGQFLGVTMISGPRLPRTGLTQGIE